jgi:hypothetical protein
MRVWVQRINKFKSSAVKFLHDFAGGHNQRHRQIQFAEQESKPPVVNSQQVRIVGNEQNGVEHRRFSNDRGIVKFFSRQKTMELVSTATSGDFCIVAVNYGETFFQQLLPFVRRKLAALPAHFPARGEDFFLPLLRLLDGRLLHFKKRLPRKRPVAKPPFPHPKTFCDGFRRQPGLRGGSESRFVPTSCGGEFNNKGTKERRILFSQAAEKISPAFAGHDFAHGLHVQLILVAPGTVFEKNQIHRRKIRNADAAGFQITQARAEIVERFLFHSRENIQIKFFHDPDRSGFDGKILRFKFARPAFAPARQTRQQFAEIVLGIANENGGVEGEARLAIEDDRQPADDREIHSLSGEAGQQLFEPGSNLPRLWRMLHARVF